MKFRHKSLMGLIYCCLLALPFVAILSRVIYVQSNKNAYQSYYGETINEEINHDIDIDDLVVNEKYLVQCNTNTYDYSVNTYLSSHWFKNLTTNELFTDFDTILFTGTTANYLALYNNGTYVRAWQLNANIQYNFEFIYEGVRNPSNIAYTFKTIEYNSYSYLDNVFEYSVNKFIENNNFGKINLFQWTTSLFFDSNNVNNMYVGFINWYLNYTLLVSTTYILFLVLMWFVNFARRLLDRGMNYDW